MNIITKIPAPYPSDCNVITKVEPFSSFVQFDYNAHQFIVSPSTSYQIGHHKVELVGYYQSMGGRVSFLEMQLTIFDYPRFSGKLKSRIEVHINEKVTYDLPIDMLYGGEGVRIEHNALLPMFIEFRSP